MNRQPQLAARRGSLTDCRRCHAAGNDGPARLRAGNDVLLAHETRHPKRAARMGSLTDCRRCHAAGNDGPARFRAGNDVLLAHETRHPKRAARMGSLTDCRRCHAAGNDGPTRCHAAGNDGATRFRAGNDVLLAHETRHPKRAARMGSLTDCRRCHAAGNDGATRFRAGNDGATRLRAGNDVGLAQDRLINIYFQNFDGKRTTFTAARRKDQCLLARTNLTPLGLDRVSNFDFSTRDKPSHFIRFI